MCSVNCCLIYFTGWVPTDMIFIRWCIAELLVMKSSSRVGEGCAAAGDVVASSRAAKAVVSDRLIVGALSPKKRIQEEVVAEAKGSRKNFLEELN